MSVKYSYAVALVCASGLSWFCVQDVEESRSRGTNPPRSADVLPGQPGPGVFPPAPPRPGGMGMGGMGAGGVGGPRAQGVGGWEPTGMGFGEMGPMGPGGMASGGMGNPRLFEAQRRQKELQQAVAEYKQAEDAEARQSHRDKISEVLSNHYDLYLKNQEEQVQQLEERIVKLRDQLDRRRDAKPRLVELKLEMVISQADGLGWPEEADSTWSSHPGFVGQASRVYSQTPARSREVELDELDRRVFTVENIDGDDDISRFFREELRKKQKLVPGKLDDKSSSDRQED